ncbi:hypothetical protein MMPV_008485 [Pyropia vietnamensis]
MATAQRWGGALAGRWGDATLFRLAAVAMAANGLAVLAVMPETGAAGGRCVADEEAPPAATNTTTIPAEADGRATVEPRPPPLLSGTSPTPPAIPARGGLAWALAAANPLPPLRLIWASPPLALLATAAALHAATTSGVASIFFFYTAARYGWGPPETGAFLSAVGVGLLLAQGVGTPLAVRLAGERAVLLGAAAADAAHLVAYAVAPSGRWMYAALVVGAVASVGSPTLKGVLARQVGRDAQGGVQGGVAAATAVGSAGGGVLAAALFGLGSRQGVPGLGMAGMGAVAAAGGVAIWAALRQPGLK